MAKPDKNKKSNLLSLDFQGVEGRILFPEGDYRVHLHTASKEEGDNHDYIEWGLLVKEGKFEGKVITERTSLSPKALWRLRNLLEAADVEVPDGPLEIDLGAVDELGEDFFVTITHEDYEGKPQARVSDYFPAGDDEKPSAAAEAKTPAKPEPEPAEAPDFDEMDEDELEVFIDEHDLDVDLDEHKKLKAKREAVSEAWDAKQAEGGEESAGAAEYDEDAINEMGTKELAEIIKKAKLDVELDGSTKTKRRAVIKALKAKKLLA